MINYNFIKKAVAISMSFVMMLSLFTGCGEKKPAEDKKNTKPATSTTVKTTKKSDKKDKTTEEYKSDVSTTTSASEKTTTKKKGTGKASSNANHERKPAPAPAVPITAVPTTTKPASQSEYKNAWSNSPEGLEPLIAAKTPSLGYKYGGIATLSDSCGWSSEISNFEANSSEDWQNRIYDTIRNIDIRNNYDTVRVFFLTKDNYRRYLGNGIMSEEVREDFNDSTFTGGDGEILAVVSYTGHFN